MFPRRIAEELRNNRDYHNDKLRDYCLKDHVPLVDIASKLRDEHFADELHPNEAGGAGDRHGGLPGAQRGAK